MNTHDRKSGLFSGIAQFWSNFWIGFFGEDRAYNRESEPDSYRFLREELFRRQKFESPFYKVREIEGSRLPSVTRNPPPGVRLGKYGYPIRIEQSKTPAGKSDLPPGPDKAPAGKIKTPSGPPKQHRPDQTFTYPITLSVDTLDADLPQETISFSLVKKPLMDRRKDELFYTYQLLVNDRPCIPSIGPGWRLIRFDHFTDPMPCFMLCSMTESVKYIDGKPRFTLNYVIRDRTRKRRKFKAALPEQDGVVEALKFFYTLQYYETWEEYDDMHDLCPDLGMKARDVRDNIRRELCELGLKLGGR